MIREEFRPVTPALEPLRRIAAYAVCTDADGRVLLVRASSRSGTPGVWSLPGGAVDHGEDPNHTVVRETAAETGLSVAVTGLRDVLADMRSLPHRGVTIHTDRLHLPRSRSAAARSATGSASRPTWPAGTPWTRRRRCRCARSPPARWACRRGRSTCARTRCPTSRRSTPCPGPDGLHRAQRFAAYAVATDPAGRVLLTRVAAGYPGRRLLAPARRRHRLRRAARRGADPRAGRGDRPARAG